MGFSLRTITDAGRFSENVRLNMLERAVPQATVEAVLVDLDATEQRTRKLPAALTTLGIVSFGLKMARDRFTLFRRLRSESSAKRSQNGF